MDKSDIVVQAVSQMQKSAFGVTALKVELEAHIGRRRGGDDWCEWCEEGYVECSECYGAWEGERCESGCDDGYLDCPQGCDEGYVTDVENNDRVRCPNGDCDNGVIRCTDCYNEGWYDDCEYCEEGSNICGECDGNYEGNNRGYGDVSRCHNYIMEKLSHLGLAESGTFHLAHGGISDYVPVAPLMYAEFYNDGSVDSELTFTLKMDKPENVLLLPKFVEIFKEFAEEAGTCFNVGGAGMHMAVLNNAECRYPVSDVSNRDIPEFSNFKKSMGLLMPALYFLGSSNEQSRGTGYRRPEIGRGTHRTAIDWRGGALEFRVFDTCYDNPEAILDNVVVMSNCLKYWQPKYRKTGLGKLAPNGCPFGVDGSDKLERFYVTMEHLDLLNRGLQILKPSYYTVREIKQQRKFNKTKTHVKNRVKRVRLEAEIEYKEYEDRFLWQLEIAKLHERAYMLERRTLGIDSGERMRLSPTEVHELAERDAIQAIEGRKKDKKSLAQYIEEKVKQVTSQRVGDYTLQTE